MLPTISPAGQQFVNSVNGIQSRLNIAQQQLSTGLRLNQPSDAPDAVSPVLQLHAEIQQNQNIQDGLNAAQLDLNTADQALSSSVSLLQNASVLATQATAPGQTAETRAVLAQSVQGLLEQMVSNSQTTVAGRYIFSGDLDQAPQYQLNLDAPTGVDRLQTSASTKLVRDSGNATFSASVSGNVIFDHRNADDTPASDNTFAALNGLRVALLNNDTDGITKAIPALQTASTYLNSQLSFYGQALNRVSSGIDQTKSTDVQLRSALSGKTDADMTQAITALTEGQTQLQAALAAQARMPRTSLFDVLPTSG